MKVLFKCIAVITIISSMLTSCTKAIAPENKLWRPWTRTIDSDSAIIIGSKISINVEGITEPLYKENKLLNKELEKKLEILLTRRGYKFDNNNPDYKLNFTYKTTRALKNQSLNISAFTTYQRNNFFNSQLNTTSYSLATGFAQLLYSSTSVNSVTKINRSEDITFFSHSITIEVVDKDKNIVWSGDSNWESQDIDFLTNCNLAVKLLLVNIPKKLDYFPELQMLQPSKINNFYMLKCAYNWFSSPAIPYKIRFENLNEFEKAKIKHNRYSSASYVDSEVSNYEYLPGYIDLLENSEEALPSGYENYTEPLDKTLWRVVLLGGTYKNKDGGLVNLLVKLTGRESGYIVEKCWVANENEWKDYETKLKTWNKALSDYIDVYIQ